MTARGLAISGALAILALAACGPAAGDDKAFGDRVRAYLLAHPEVIQEASEKLQAQQEAEQEAAMRKAQAELPRFAPPWSTTLGISSPIRTAGSR